MTDINHKVMTRQGNDLRKMVSFGFDPQSIEAVQNEISQHGWCIVHVLNRGKRFVAILEKDFIKYDEKNQPIVYIPARKNFKWCS